jgi:E3 ubiquitin-protein ligase DOA10
MFVKQGENVLDVEPGSKLYVPDLKIDTQKALAISQEFQSLLENAETRLKNMEDLQRLTKEKLTDRLNALDNVIASEMSRWQKRYETSEKSTELKMENLRERLSDKNYRLKDKRKKDEQKLVSDFTRTTSELERFFAALVEDIKNMRSELSSKDNNAEHAVERYRTLLSILDQKTVDYRDLVASTNDAADGILQESLTLDNELTSAISEEEQATEAQIQELHVKLEEMKEEMSANAKFCPACGAGLG